jgi:nitrite reductase (NO-forming)
MTVGIIEIGLVMSDAPSSLADTIYVARDAASVPSPINRAEPITVPITSTIQEVTAELDDGVNYTFWTFDGTVPGPLMRVMQGDTVELTLVNPPNSHMAHNIDLHAVNGPHGGGMETIVAPGESKTFTFQASHAGGFVYHCAYSPAWRHIAQGMYGAIVVEPPGGLAEVDREFYIMQGEWYTTGAFGTPGNQTFSTTKAFGEQPEYFTLNGHADALTELYPLEATAGETIRIFFGVGGPNVGSNFHVIGEIFDKVYTGSPDMFVQNEETWYVPPGSMAIFEFTVDKPGDYLLVDHALTRVARGALGMLHVTAPEVVPEPCTGQTVLLALAACMLIRTTVRSSVRTSALDVRLGAPARPTVGVT